MIDPAVITAAAGAVATSVTAIAAATVAVLQARANGRKIDEIQSELTQCEAERRLIRGELERVTLAVSGLLRRESNGRTDPAA